MSEPGRWSSWAGGGGLSAAQHISTGGQVNKITNDPPARAVDICPGLVHFANPSSARCGLRRWCRILEPGCRTWGPHG